MIFLIVNLEEGDFLLALPVIIVQSAIMTYAKIAIWNTKKSKVCLILGFKLNSTFMVMFKKTQKSTTEWLLFLPIQMKP